MVGVCVRGGGGGACVAVGMHAGEMATKAGGTHPTGMHYYLEICLMFFFRFFIVENTYCSSNVRTLKCADPIHPRLQVSGLEQTHRRFRF